ncbi:MAG: hypothetical protein WCA07_18025 [Gloeobacterales cyanobacterium]
MQDFAIVEGPDSIHLCNAPSPAATAAIPIAQMVVDRIARRITLPSSLPT